MNSGIDGGMQQPPTENMTSTLNSLLQMQQAAVVNPTRPIAYLNYVFLDEHMNFVPEESGCIQINQEGVWHTLETPYLTVPNDGYLQVFVSNLSTVDVQFDNLQLGHWQGNILEEINYYSYGLYFGNTKAALAGANNFLYNSKELQRDEFGVGNGLALYDYGGRTYDPQIGRWFQTDPLAQMRESQAPYSFCSSDPITALVLAWVTLHLKFTEYLKGLNKRSTGNVKGSIPYLVG